MQIKDEVKRNKIIEISTKLFQEKDFHSVRLEEIAQLAGISKSSIYTYYKNKNDLFYKCLNDGIDDFLNEIETNYLQKNFTDCFEDVIKITLKLGAIKGPLLAILFKNGPSSITMSQEEVIIHNEAKKRGIAILEKVFKKGIDEGCLVSDYSAKRMAIVFQGLFPINLHMVLNGENPLTYEQIYSMFMSVFKK